ncbi:MAG: polysaccharide biosynthesis/export family protein [Candidatus Omnitrophica bacterium]|nr:polysaccharide biosynthesis/export family protein [Candidatus Omnitrophota bacterium]
MNSRMMIEGPTGGCVLVAVAAVVAGCYTLPLVTQARPARPADAMTLSQRLDLLTAQAQAAERSGNAGAAAAVWKQILSIDPRNVAAREGLALARRQLGEPAPREPSTEASALAQRLRDYKVNQGDVIEVFVWQRADLSRDVTVRPDGMIAVPLAGDVPAMGRTLSELDADVTQRLQEAVGGPVAGQEITGSGQAMPVYTVNPGDVLEVYVWQQSDLTRDVIVRPDGIISLPLAGDLYAAGRTLPELDDEITEKFGQFVRDPDVTVALKKTETGATKFIDVSLAIKRFGGTKVIVMGQVKAPGVYGPTGDARLAEVVAMAGGASVDADLRSVFVVHGGQQYPEVIRANLSQFIRQGDAVQNIALRPNDIVYIPRTFVATTTDFLEQFYPSISEALVGVNLMSELGAGGEEPFKQ